MPAVSVILPTCDRPHLLPRALGSILNQTWTDFEVLVIDANRRDPSVQSQPEMARLLRDPRVRVIETAGFSSAALSRNRGLDEARGTWITYLDDDDEYLPEKVESQLVCAVRTGMPLVLCGFEARLGIRSRRRQVGVGKFSGDALLTAAIWNTPFIFHHRSGVRFDPALLAGEDKEYALRLCKAFKVHEVPNVPQPLCRVHVGAEARVNSVSSAVWVAQRTILMRQGREFTSAARRLFCLRARLARLKLTGGPARAWWRIGRALVAVGGNAEFRAILNALAFRVPVLRPWLLI